MNFIILTDVASEAVPSVFEGDSVLEEDSPKEKTKFILFTVDKSLSNWRISEFLVISSVLDRFSKDDESYPCIVISYSGDDKVATEISSERPEMILTLNAANKNSAFYTDKPKELFLELQTIFRGD